LFEKAPKLRAGTTKNLMTTASRAQDGFTTFIALQKMTVPKVLAAGRNGHLFFKRFSRERIFGLTFVILPRA
jgi:hypothetical protein